MENTYKLNETNILTVNKPTVFSPSNVLTTLRGVFAGLVNQMSASLIQPRKVVIVGTGDFAGKLYNLLNGKTAFGYKFMGFFDNQIQNNVFQSQVKGNLNELKAYCLNHKIDEIYYTLPLQNRDELREITKFAEENFIYLQFNTPKLLENLSASFIEEMPIMSIQRHPLASRLNKIAKRAFDVVFSLFVLAILVPFVFPIIALLIKLESRGPIFFVQKRPGLKNQLFPCLKFRSMSVNNNGDVQATKNDARVTRVGAFLRKTSLDELPQFINVLKGEMSVVGPRPNMQKQLEFYSQHIPSYSARHFVKPGITGHAQVNGFRGETHTIDLMEKRVEHDIHYINNWNLAWDAKIVFLTAYNIVKGEKNAY